MIYLPKNLISLKSTAGSVKNDTSTHRPHCKTHLSRQHCTPVRRGAAPVLCVTAVLSVCT